MATERLSMRKTREILRQKWALERSHRDIAQSLGMSPGAIGTTVSRANIAKLDWAQVEELDDQQLETKLYGVSAARCRNRPLPPPEYIHGELHKTGVTLQLLHIEYLEQNPEGYKYTQFCEHYRRWLKKRGLTMRQIHRAGEKTFVDYSGKKPEIIDARTGEATQVEMYVAALGASNYTYAEATMSQKSQDWIASHVRAFEYFGGVTEVVVPDQLKAGVTRPCRYEPGIQRTYEEMAGHYGTAIAPARPGKSRDKAKVEGAVLVAQRWILARIRNQTFFSLAELNERIAELLEELNARMMKIYGKSRRQLFEELDRPALKPLPERRFAYGEWKVDVGVNIDYHIQLDFHYYSAPFQLVGERVDVRFNALLVEIFFKGRRVASHVRSSQRGGFTTDPAHRPKSHREHAQWTPSRLVHWGSTIGTNTEALIAAILEERPHPEQGYRSCLGILRLGKRYGGERLERASQRALAAKARSYKHVEAILKNGLDRLPLITEQPKQRQLPLVHENVRGAEYYANREEDGC
jgi:transposase